MNNDYTVKFYNRLAKISYDAYCVESGGVSAVTGQKLPEFEKTSQKVQDCWVASVKAVYHDLNSEKSDSNEKAN